MAELLDPAANIFEGVWINWTKGKVQGLTWTLCPTQATLLTNCLALFVTLSGGQLWTIIRFGLHQRRAHKYSEDEQGQQAPQQQLILRNAGTDLHTMRLMALLAWRSKGAPGGPFRYAVSVAMLAIVHYLVFVVAGTFSNYLINAGTGEPFNNFGNATSAVLSRSPMCGFWDPTYRKEIVEGFHLNTDSPETVYESIQLNSKGEQSVELSLAYARECYESDFTYEMSSKCNTMKRPKLSFNQSSDDECPFARHICNQRSSTIVFETAPIDSHNDLGINAPPEHRLIYRRRTRCAAIDGRDHVIEEDRGTSAAVAYAYYGEQLGGVPNYTYSYANFSSMFTSDTATTLPPYQLSTQAAFATDQSNYGMTTFVPITELQQDSADLILFFLSAANGRYLKPVHDPWFSATIPIAVDIPVEFARTQYVRESMITTLGCTEQHQFCTPDGDCTPFAGWYQIHDNSTFSAALTPLQNVTFDRMLRAVFASSIAQVVYSLQATKTPLLAINQAAIAAHPVSLKLPDHQWQLELENWHNVSMAHFQRTLVQWATGQIAPDPQSQLVRATKGPGAWFCRNLVVPSTMYQSFSVLWLTVVLVIGTFIILISWTVEEIPTRARYRSHRMSVLRRVWDQDHILELQRRKLTRSWVPPPPPPKESSPSLPTSRLPPYVTPPGMAPTPYIQYPTHHSNVPHPDFSWFQAPEQKVVLNEKHSYEERPEVSTSRLWSQLPREPVRDSWLETGLGQRAAMHTIDSSQISEIKVTADTSPATPERNRPAKSIDLSSLRAHALARNRGLYF